MPHEYVLRSDYFVLICSNLISVPETNLNPVEFCWNSVDSLSLPNKYIVTLTEICTARCQCSKFGTSCTAFCKCIGEECCTEVYQ